MLYGRITPSVHCLGLLKQKRASAQKRFAVSGCIVTQIYFAPGAIQLELDALLTLHNIGKDTPTDNKDVNGFFCGSLIARHTSAICTTKGPTRAKPNVLATDVFQEATATKSLSLQETKKQWCLLKLHKLRTYIQYSLTLSWKTLKARKCKTRLATLTESFQIGGVL